MEVSDKLKKNHKVSKMVNDVKRLQKEIVKLQVVGSDVSIKENLSFNTKVPSSSVANSPSQPTI